MVEKYGVRLNASTTRVCSVQDERLGSDFRFSVCNGCIQPNLLILLESHIFPMCSVQLLQKNALISSRTMLHLVDSTYMVEVNLRSIVLLDPLQNGRRVIFFRCR